MHWTNRVNSSLFLILVIAAMTVIGPACAALAEGVRQPQPKQRLALLDPEGTTFQLYEGLTLLINNQDNKAFNLNLDVRDLNLFETGPREILFKVYDPQGKAVVREVIPDDGVTSPASLSPTGGWDHEAWYYIHDYNRGGTPMLRWSAMTSLDRLAATPVRTFETKIPASGKGMYRVVLVGVRDHVVTVKIDQKLPWAAGGNPFFIHPVGDFLRHRFVYVPRGATSLMMSVVEHDRPRTTRFILRDQENKVLIDGNTSATTVTYVEIKPDKPGEWDDKVFSLEIPDASNQCMVQMAFAVPKHEGISRPWPNIAAQAYFASDVATARALQGGAIYHDGQTFWQPSQVRLHDWLKKLTPADFEVKGEDGKAIQPVSHTNERRTFFTYDIKPNRNAEFYPLNGVHEQPPLSDTIMFSYDLHHQRQALNVAIRDVAAGLRLIGPGDHVMDTTWRGMANLAYEFGTYRFHWWRPASKLLHEKDTPEEVKEILRDAVLNAGDRLAFCDNWERVNGNAFVTVLCGLRYVYAGTGDKLNEQLFNTFYDRFTHGGFGQRVGLGASGAIQEEFAYDNHYGSYPTKTLDAVARDFQDPKFIEMRDNLLNFYSYVRNNEVAACPWSARTSHNPDYPAPTEGPYTLKCLGGPDLTASVNNANEFFAARRKNYYIVSYHGRITPKWEGDSFRGQMGWSGGVLCQFVVPGKGTVLASTIDPPGYGTNMHPSQWRTFRINSIVGETADGKPLIGADCEHPDAKLIGNTASGSGEVRDSSVHASRSYTYNADHVLVQASLHMTDDDESLNFWFKSPFRGQIAQAWEMIPFVAKGATVKVLNAGGVEAGVLTETLIEGQTVVIDRGGYGVRIELEKPMKIKRGAGDTVMIQLIAETPLGPRDDKTKPNVEDAAIKYKLVPFGG